tara:strand:+ start:14421 stop:14570 length:150 start_codon:yes stop_codon:yes gene_type:complete
MDEVTIRSAGVEDADVIHHIQLRSVGALCSKAYSDEQMTAWLTNRSPQM